MPWMTKLVNEPRGLDRLMIEVASALSLSGNQLLAMMLMAHVTMGPVEAMTVYPMTIHQKLLLTAAIRRIQAPIDITMAEMSSTVRDSYRL